MLFPNPDQQMEQIGLHLGIFTFRFTSKFQNSRAKIEEPFFVKTIFWANLRCPSLILTTIRYTIPKNCYS